MKCPNCKSTKITVWHTEKYPDAVRRLRLCEHCRNAWWTVETFFSPSKKEINPETPEPKTPTLFD